MALPHWHACSFNAPLAMTRAPEAIPCDPGGYLLPEKSTLTGVLGDAHGGPGLPDSPTSCWLRCHGFISEAAGFEALSPVRREAGASMGAGGSHEASLCVSWGS